MSSTTPRRSPRNAIRPKVTAPAHIIEHYSSKENWMKCK